MEKKELKTATEVLIKYGNGVLVCEKCGKMPVGKESLSGFIEFPPNCSCGGKWTIKPSKLKDN